MAVVSLLLLTALLPYLGRSAYVDMGIVNGTETKPHSRPYMVSVQRSGRHICGGFLVSEHFVMTAAHCWNQGEKLTVVLGMHELPKSTSTKGRMEVKFYHIHPMYDSNTLFNDIMLLQLNGTAKKSKQINWISIPNKDKDIKAKSVCSVAGWGKQKSSGTRSARLMEVDVSIIDKKACQKYWDRAYSVSRMVCAGGHGGFCQGDSGGPLVCKGTAVGIVSFTDDGDCSYPKRPNVYTKISKFLPWIKGIMGTNFNSSRRIVSQSFSTGSELGSTSRAGVKAVEVDRKAVRAIPPGSMPEADGDVGEVVLTSTNTSSSPERLTDKMNTLHQVLLAALFCALAFDATYEEEIINGRKAKKNSLQHMASVQVNGKHKCGGFLIDASYVLTAAHCDDRDNMSVVLGAQDISRNNLIRYEVKSKHKHPSYKDPKTGNDIMLLKLSSSVKQSKSVKIVKIPNKDKPLKPKTKCQVAGWGKTEKQNSVNDLLVTDVSTVSFDDCQKEWAIVKIKLPPNVLCAGGYGTKSGACQGDSGGPLVCGGTAVGIVSFNLNGNCDYPNVPNVYTKISKFTTWIKKIITKGT
ncbi:transmembrane protease serine 9-like [Colossoma macropomum]|uniref:transmembrane protease serine 9-like n=1 Tax=Colossoma macropomum TaxID=42526 RepID=UPI0018640E41|nr:transmembrane protease serine 9-like [Colossoma macropomum]